MGSGSVGVAALRLGRRFLGNDLNPEAVQIADSGSAARRSATGHARATHGQPPPRPAQADLLDRCPSVDDRRANTPTWSPRTCRDGSAPRGLKVYREIRVGKTIIGKNRCIDIFCVSGEADSRVRDRVQVPGQPGHRRREDPLRARRSAGAADGRLHRLRRPRILRRRAAHARRLAARRLLPAGSEQAGSTPETRASWITCWPRTSAGGTSSSAPSVRCERTMASERKYLPAASLDLLLPAYDPIMRLLGFTKALRPLVEQAELLPRYTVLDIGCGTGALDLVIKEAHPEVTVTAIDPDPRALARAGRKAKRAGVTVRFDRGFADALPYPDEAFDRVFSSMMLHHVPRADKLSVTRVKSGGC